MKINIKHITIIIAAVALLAVPSVVSAEDVADERLEKTTQETTSNTSEKTVEQLKKARELAEQKRKALEARKQITEKKLDDAKRKICDTREKRINTIMNGMDTRRQHAFDRITKVSDAAQAFYAKKGLAVGNYDQLVNTINTTKATAAATMTEQKALPTFSCNSDKPKTELQAFKDKRAASTTAMKAYREAVRNLVKSIREAAKATASTNSTTQTGEQS